MTLSDTSAGAMVKQEKDENYLGDIMDIFGEESIKRHSNYKYPVSSRGSMSSDIIDMSDEETSRRSPVSTRPNTGASSKPPALTPRQFLTEFEEKGIPALDETLDKTTGEIDYNKYISSSLHEQVHENVREWYKGSSGPPPDAELPFSRCVVCTLPFGSCVHTRDWLQYTAPVSRAKSRGEEEYAFDPTEVRRLIYNCAMLP